MTTPKPSAPKPAKERPFRCAVRGCKLDFRAHGRKAAYIEETEGPLSAMEFDKHHYDRNAPDDR